MNFSIDKVIYSYLFVCCVLLIYNIIYIAYSKRGKKKYNKKVNGWKKEIRRQLHNLNLGRVIEESHKKLLNKKLNNVNELIFYVRALDSLRDTGVKLEKYIQENYLVIQELAYKYARKESMSRAFFAYFIFKNPPQKDKEYSPLMEILISYMDNSTVYCRENVLNALYALGNSQAIENSLQIMNDRQWFHHRKLLSDGLLTFAGDKYDLAERLWNYFQKWDDNIMVSVIQFITAYSSNFKTRFFSVLQSEDVSLDIKLAIMRYYRRYIYKPVEPLLIAYLNDEKEVDENIKIVAAAILDKYPSEETIETLKRALNHRNWYLRYNAALSLVNLKVDIERLQDILEGKDRYAKEILSYMIEQRKVGEAQ